MKQVQKGDESSFHKEFRENNDMMWKIPRPIPTKDSIR